ncbi:MAG: hypothetical protein KDD99_23110, partial [Bacteroidetes bacterium]|nr:hypothetical protein [Bacteroidota bacterium]
MGNRYSPSKMVNKPWEEVTQEDIKKVRDEIQSDMQVELDRGVEEYGKKPFHVKEVIRNHVKYWRSLPYWTPLGWPALFSEYDRRYYRERALPTRITRGLFRFWYIVWKNPIVIAYFLPIIGWIPLLFRGLWGRRKVKPWEGSKVK